MSSFLMVRPVPPFTVVPQSSTDTISSIHAGQLRPIAPVHLNTILELLLNYLISLNLAHEAAPVEDLISALADEHDIPREVSDQIMSWFGQVEEGTWKMDVNTVVAEIGLGIIRHYKVPPSYCIYLLVG